MDPNIIIASFNMYITDKMIMVIQRCGYRYYNRLGTTVESIMVSLLNSKMATLISILKKKKTKSA